MKIRNKVLVSVLLVVAMVLSGCGATASPDDVVKKFSDALIKYDMETMSSCCADANESIVNNPEESDDEMSIALLDYVKGESAKSTYEVTNMEKGDETATVTVKYTVSDISPIVKDAVGNYMLKAIAAAFSGQDVDETGEIFLKCFNDSKEEIEIATTDIEVKFSCVLVEKEWKIKSVSDETVLGNVMTCNMIQAFESIGDAFDSDSSSDNNTPSSLSTAEQVPAKDLTVEYVENDGILFKDYSGDVNVSSWVSYKNTSDVPIKFTDVYIDYVDNDGKLLGSDQMCQCIPEALNPGETGYIYSYYYELGSAYTDNGCKPEIHYALKPVNDLYTVEVTDVVFKTGGFMDVEVTCRATNNGNSDVSWANPGAVFYDADGKVVGFCYGVESFAAGQQTTFNISGDMMAYKDDPNKVKSVKVFIQGDNSLW